MNLSKRPPTIVIGMHRSGTTMITQMLEKLGLFVGSVKERNHEAVFFLKLNNWLFTQSGGAWDNPQPIHYLLKNDQARDLAVDHLKTKLQTPYTLTYLGPRNYLKYRSIPELDFTWGWKDPRTTFTLPVWLALFPNAKVIHIYRHGVDVVSSLKVRQQECLETSAHQRKPAYRLYGRQERFADSLRCSTLDGGFSLWEEYMQEARSHLAMLGSQATEIKYEDFLDNPHYYLEILTEFCDLNATANEVEEVAKGVKRSRAHAYQHDRELSSFAQQVASRLKPYGYS